MHDELNSFLLTNPNTFLLMRKIKIHLILQYLIILYFKDMVALLTLTTFYSNGIIFERFFYNDRGYGKAAVLGLSFVTLPLCLLALVGILLVMCLVVKWILIGNFKRLQTKGLMAVDSWGAFRWLIANEMIHTACELPLGLINEFWLTATFWKLMGAKIGKNTLIDPNVLIFEADLLKIGDNCRIEEEVTLLSHKFNDGGLKLDRIVIPNSTYIQTRAVIFAGSEIIDEYVTMLPLTPLNPGEKLTAGHWQGSPAERVNIKTGNLLPNVVTQRTSLMSQRTSMSMNDIA